MTPRRMIKCVAMVAWLAAYLGGCGEEAADTNDAKKSGTEIGVVVKTFQNEPIYETLTLPGNVEAIEDTTISAEVAGQLASLAVTEGQTVKADDPIAEIDPATAKAMLNQAVKQVASAEKAKEAAVAGLTVAGAGVKTAEAGVTEAQATGNRAAQKLASIEKLYKDGDATQDERDEAATLAAVAAARVLRAKAGVNSAKANIISAQAAIEQAEAAVAVAEANQKLAQINRDKHTIKSPVAGTVDDLPVDPKEFVRVGTPLCRIVRTDKLKVIVNMPERDVQFAEAMQRRYEKYKKANPDARRKPEPTGNERSLRDDQPLIRFKMLKTGLQRYGVIEWIARVADPMTRTYETRILIDNKTEPGLPTIRPGMIATVQIVRRVNRQAISVPLDALATRGGRAVIYLYKPDKDNPDVGTAVEETAKFGLMDSTRVQIIGLNPGVCVIVNWDIELSAGDRVRVKKRQRE